MREFRCDFISLLSLSPAGHLGTFTLSLHWRNLGNQPVELLIEDVYLLVVPSSQGNQDPKENEARMQAAKQERLENAELLHLNRNQAAQVQGLSENCNTPHIFGIYSCS